MQPAITLRGVRVHNLKAVDVDFPLGKLTVVTGVSGAGKSSLVFDTLHAEARRRYLQASSQQVLERLERPEADAIGELPPAVAIRSLPARVSPRATVGALTEISHHLRTWFARAGVIVCPSCGERVVAHRSADVVAALHTLPTGTRRIIAFPATVPDNDSAAWLASLREGGFIRIQVAGSARRLDEPSLPTLTPGDTIWILLDRVEIGKTPGERLTESIEAACRLGHGRMGVLASDSGMAPETFDQRHVCARCQRVFPAPEPRLFDPHDPLGGCAACGGTGVVGKPETACATCAGNRWNADTLAVQIDGHSIADWHVRPIHELADLQDAPEPIRHRLTTLASLDLGWLTLQQRVDTLSDGVGRRIALANALESNLIGVLYLIDEPSAGMHPGGVHKVGLALRRLCSAGNTVVVIEHARDIIGCADHVIDLGPGSGADGGAITYHGPPSGLDAAPGHPTSDFWTRRSFIEIPAKRRPVAGMLKLMDPINVDLPMGVLCVVAGVNGIGHHRLVVDNLYPALCLARKKKTDVPAVRVELTGGEGIADVILLDQAPLERSARSNPATYLKIFDEIRALFAATMDARIRNLGPGHFSFNQPGGRCEACEGHGRLTVDLHILGDVATACPECQGRRYRKDTLDIKVCGLSIAEVLDLTVREAFRFFRAQPAIEKKLKVLIDVGLDYLRLGQPVDVLTGSECQRLRLAGHLATSRKAGCLFLFIEPTTGLHPADVVSLLACFDRLLSAGHSLILVENDLDVISCADQVIDMASDSVVARGTPEEVAASETPTGRALRSRFVGQRS